MPRNSVSLGCAVVVLGVGGATAIRMLLDPYVDHSQVFSWYYAAVMLAAWCCGWQTALVSLVLGFLAADWFFLEPRQSFVMATGDFQDLMGLATYALVGASIIALAELIRRTNRVRQIQLANAGSSPIACYVPPDEVHEVAAAVRRHGLTSQDLWHYLSGLNAGPGMLEFGSQFKTQELSTEELASRLEEIAR